MIHINEDVLADAGLSLPEYLILLFHASTKEDFNKVEESVWSKGYLRKEVGGFTFTSIDRQKVNRILAKSNYHNKIDLKVKESVKDLAKNLMDIYPDEVRPESGHLFKGNLKDVIDSLLDFFSVYGSYPFEKIEQAVQEYVNNLNGDYTYMQNLRNFIFKVENSGESTSQLASYLENLE